MRSRKGAKKECKKTENKIIFCLVFVVPCICPLVSLIVNLLVLQINSSMGTNAHNVDIRNIPGHNPPLNQFQLVSSGPNYYLWQNRVVPCSVIEYTFNVTSSSLLQQHIQSYMWRHNNPLLVSTTYFKEEDEKEKYSIFYERVFTNLARIKDLCFQDSLEFYYVGLKGFHLLCQHFGPFEVEESMFHITQDSKVKVWCDKNIARIYPSTSPTSQQAMVKQIIQIIEENTDHAQAPVRVANVLRQSCRSFDKTIERFVRLCKDCNFHLFNQLKCLYTIYRGGVEDQVDEFGQSSNPKKKLSKQEDKISEASARPANHKLQQKPIGLQQTKKQISYSSPKTVQLIPKPNLNFTHHPVPMRANHPRPIPRSVQPRQAYISPQKSSQPILITNHQPQRRMQSKPIGGANIAKKFYNISFQYKNPNSTISTRQTNLTKRNMAQQKVMIRQEDTRYGINNSISPIKQFSQDIKTDQIEGRMGQSKVLSKNDEQLRVEKQKQEGEDRKSKSNQITYKSMLQKLKAKYNSISYNNQKVPQFSYDYQSTNDTTKPVINRTEIQPINKFELQSSWKLTMEPTKTKSINRSSTQDKKHTNFDGQVMGQWGKQKKYVPEIDEDIWKDMLNLKSRGLRL